MSSKFVGYGKKLFDLALGRGKSNVSTTIVGVEPKVGSLTERRKQFEDVVKRTGKHTKGLTDEGKIKVKETVSPVVSKISKIMDKKDKIVKGGGKRKFNKGGRVGLRFGTKKKSNVQKIKETFGPGSSNPKKSAAKKKKFPDLTGDGKVTFADILKGRGVKRG